MAKNGQKVIRLTPYQNAQFLRIIFRQKNALKFLKKTENTLKREFNEL